MAPKKSKVKKRVVQPAKGIIERTICAHPMLKRVQKEVRELKKKSAKKHKKIIRYQIVSTYFLDGAFKVLFFGLKTCLQPSFVLIVRTLVLPPNTLKTCSHYMLCGYKKKWANLRGLQGGANVNKKQLKSFCLGTWEFARGASQ
jgi:hypothetical protein